MIPTRQTTRMRVRMRINFCQPYSHLPTSRCTPMTDLGVEGKERKGKGREGKGREEKGREGKGWEGGRYALECVCVCVYVCVCVFFT